MKIAKTGVSLIQRIIRSVFLKIWMVKNSSSGNVHLTVEQATLKKIPFHKDRVWLRQTQSDVGRVAEYTSSIYFKKSYLHDKLKEEGPTVLIDIGGNIGLSSLSIVNEFNSIKE